MPRVRLLPSIALLASVGCAAANVASGKRPPIATDRVVYAVDDTLPIVRLTINMVYRNTTGGDVYLPTCRGPQPPRLQKKVGDSSWVVAFSPNVMGCEESPITIRAGDEYPYSFQIVAGKPGSSFAPRFAVSELPGTYRVLWEIFRTSKEIAGRPPIMTDTVAVEQEISNSFQLVTGR